MEPKGVSIIHHHLHPGGVTRLLVSPLIRSLEMFFGNVPFLRYLDGFRYPLAGEDFLSNPMQSDFIPSWKRVISAIPDFLDQFYEAVELDNKEHG